MLELYRLPSVDSLTRRRRTDEQSLGRLMSDTVTSGKERRLALFTC